MDFLAPSSQAGRIWLQLQLKAKAIRALWVLSDNPKGVAYSWSKCCRSTGWGLANICLDRAGISRGMDVAMHWVLVSRQKEVCPGESQRLLHYLVWPPNLFLFHCLLFIAHTMVCSTGDWLASHVNAELFLHVFSFLPSTCNFFISMNSKLPCSHSFLDSYMIPVLLMLLVSQLLCFWLAETSIALLHFHSVRELWLFGKCTKGKRKIWSC